MEGACEAGDDEVKLAFCGCSCDCGGLTSDCREDIESFGGEGAFRWSGVGGLVETCAC